MNNSELKLVLDHLQALPAIPKIARELLSLQTASYEGEQALLKLIRNDPPISAKLVGMANSSLLGTSRKIVSVDDAIALLGIKRVKVTALSFAMMTSMARTQAGMLNVNNLWRHTLTIALVMYTLSLYMPPDARPDEDDIFLAGLLHDIGFLVLDFIDPMSSDKFHARLAAEHERSLEEIECATLEMDHCELGAELGIRWGLPEDIVAVLRYHHHPNNPQAFAGQLLVNMVNLAEKILPPFVFAEQIRFDIDREDWQSLGIDPCNATEIIENIRDRAKEMAAAVC